jgi:hypothetical protein
MAKRREVIGFSTRTARRVRTRAGGVNTSVVAERRNRGGGSKLRFFKLLEDVGSGNVDVWAEDSNRIGSSLGGGRQVASWGVDGIIRGASAGYHGLFGMVDGDWCFVQGDCITPCESDGTITPGSVPNGTVGVAYSHTVTSANLNGDLAITGLPPGLSDGGSGAISGTPTTAGRYLAIATGTSPKTAEGATGDCTITKVVVINIAAAPEA